MPRRLIEEAFPLQKVSEDSKHEKNVRHGHISTLHIWPARRPLAACRAVTIATLLPDPGDAPQTMKDEYKRLSGSSIADKQRDYLCKLIEGLTRWGSEDGGAEWDAKGQKGRWLNKLRIARELIQTAYGGQPPHVLDMFAGGGAIPLEAMRLGCKVTANDYNPVAWFILKCTLEYPQRLAGKTLPLPQLELDEQPELKTGGLSEHVRLWGQWVSENARGELARYYPVVDGKPTVAYLWTRTVPCQDPQCGGTVPLLKTLWVCKKPEKTLPDTPENRERPDFLRLKKTKNQTKVIINAKRALKLFPDKATKQVCFEIVAPKDNSEVDKPTMSGTSATCPFCGVQQPKTYIKRCGQEGKLKAQMTTVIYQETYGKEYRAPTSVDMSASEIPTEALEAISNQIPHGILDEPLPSKERHRAVGSQLPDYGFQTWSDLFTDRQLLALMTFVKWTRASRSEMEKIGYSPEWVETVEGYLACLIDKTANRNSQQCLWISTNAEKAAGSFGRFALPMGWDFVEVYPWSQAAGGVYGGLENIVKWVEHAIQITNHRKPCIRQVSSCDRTNQTADAIITDPPYYDAIPYADLSDFFYVWLRRSIGDRFPDVFAEPLTPKSEELVQQHKTGKRGKIGKEFYEKGMSETFLSAHDSLLDDARMVIVFAHKDPDAWETLVNAMVASGLVVTASWPIDTERQGKVGAQGTASLATSLWFVCRKRPANARAGHYGKVRRDMHERLTERLRDFWDAGIRGPDFVWAAIGPALESYSSYTEVRRMDGKPFTVSEFLKDVRRMVTDFALGQILHGANTEELDEWTRYYLMHRDYFGMVDAPVGECILLAQGYGLSLDDLSGKDIGILRRTASGNKRRLLAHIERDSERVGSPHPSGELPMIDKIHRVMNLWAQGNRAVLDAYLHEQGLGENELFKAVVQALIETSCDAKERSLLETLMGYEPGDYQSVSSAPSRDERQQYFEGVR